MTYTTHNTPSFSLYLGLGTMGPVDAMRNQPFPFLLRGPYNHVDPADAPAIVQKDVVVDAEQGLGGEDAAWVQQRQQQP